MRFFHGLFVCLLSVTHSHTVNVHKLREDASNANNYGELKLFDQVFHLLPFSTSLSYRFLLHPLTSLYSLLVRASNTFFAFFFLCTSFYVQCSNIEISLPDFFSTHFVMFELQLRIVSEYTLLMIFVFLLFLHLIFIYR